MTPNMLWMMGDAAKTSGSRSWNVCSACHGWCIWKMYRSSPDSKIPIVLDLYSSHICNYFIKGNGKCHQTVINGSHSACGQSYEPLFSILAASEKHTCHFYHHSTSLTADLLIQYVIYDLMYILQIKMEYQQKCLARLLGAEAMIPVHVCDTLTILANDNKL